MIVDGKLETTYTWTCAHCGHDNAVVDDKRCDVCEKTVTDEKVVRHFKLIPTPMRLGWVV
jgi:hypothetical protein